MLEKSYCRLYSSQFRCLKLNDHSGIWSSLIKSAITSIHRVQLQVNHPYKYPSLATPAVDCFYLWISLGIWCKYWEMQCTRYKNSRNCWLRILVTKLTDTMSLINIRQNLNPRKLRVRLSASSKVHPATWNMVTMKIN